MRRLFLRGLLVGLLGMVLGVVSRSVWLGWRVQRAFEGAVLTLATDDTDPVAVRVDVKHEDVPFERVELLRTEDEDRDEALVWLRSEDTPLRVVAEDGRVTEIFTGKGERFVVGEPDDEGLIEVEIHAPGEETSTHTIEAPPTMTANLDGAPGSPWIGVAYALDFELPYRVTYGKSIRVDLTVEGGDGYDGPGRIPVTLNCEGITCATLTRNAKVNGKTTIDVHVTGSVRSSGLRLSEQDKQDIDYRRLKILDKAASERKLAKSAIGLGMVGVGLLMAICGTSPPGIALCAAGSLLLEAGGIALSVVGGSLFLLDEVEGLTGPAIARRTAVSEWVLAQKADAIRERLRGIEAQLCAVAGKRHCADVVLPDMSAAAQDEHFPTDYRIRLSQRKVDVGPAAKPAADLSFSGKGQYTRKAKITWGAANSVTCRDQPDWEIRLNRDGTARARVKVTVDSEAGFGDDAKLACRSFPRRRMRSLPVGKHGNGEFTIPYGGKTKPIRGTYDATRITGSWSHRETLKHRTGTSTTDEEHKFSLPRAP